MTVKRPRWTEFGATAAAKAPKRRGPVYLRAGEAWVQVRTYGPEGKDAFVGNVESITAPLPAGTDVRLGDWVSFEPRHVFSVCVSHE